MKIITVIHLIVSINLNARDDFSKVVDAVIKQELKSIKKPPVNLSLVKDEFETTKEFNSRVKKTKS